MVWQNKNQWQYASDATGRRKGRIQIGSSSDHVTPTGYDAFFADFPTRTPELPNGARQPDVDAPNLFFLAGMYHSGDPFPAARNKAWGKLVEDVRKGPASLGQAFAEIGEAFDMIGGRCLQLFKGYRALRHGDFRGFLRTFGIGAKRKHRNLVRSPITQASNLWLEYSFGWSPLLKDIHDAYTAIGQPVPGGLCSGSGTELYEHETPFERFSVRGRCRMGASIYVVNPNLYLEQQLGIANPVQIAWELVPFSFVADWMFDIGTFLGAYSDLYGCLALRPYTTYSAKGPVSCYWPEPGYPLGTFSLVGNCSSVVRTPWLHTPLPNLSFRANVGTSLKRAANAASLLGQILRP